MRTSHLGLLVRPGVLGLLAFWLIAAGGCADQQKKSPPESTRAVQDRELSRRTAMRTKDDASRGGDVSAMRDRQADDAMATPPVDTPNLLARRTSSYSKELEDLLAKRQAANAARAAERADAAHDAAARQDDPSAHGSAVKWESSSSSPTTSELAQSQPTLSKPHGEAAPVTVKPTIDAGPTVANRPAMVASASPASPPPPQLDRQTPSAATRAAGANDGAVVATESSPSSSRQANARTAGASMGVGADDLEQRLAKRVKDYPRDIATHLEYQLLMFLKDQPVPDLNAIASLPTEDREMVTAILDGLTNFRNNVRADNNMLLSKKVKPLLDAADRLRSQAELTIPTLALCTRVDGFGRYDPVDPARFAAGKVTQTIVYCEIENFASQLDSTAKQWQTELTQDATIFTETGLPVWSDKQAQIVDTSRNRRHDFFVRKVIDIPANLNLGRYVLKVTIVDKEANRVAEASMPIQIVAQP